MAGAWAGSVIYSTDDELLVLVTEEKWAKGKSQLQELKNIIKKDNVSRKRLQEIRGFLNYIVMTYPLILSYLVGLHLTIDGWRRGRDSSGWRNFSYDPLAEQEKSMHQTCHGNDDGPSEVIVKPRLRSDVMALETLMQSDTPPLRRARSKHMIHVFYGFGDASGSAFGTTLGHAGKIFFE